MKVLYLGVYRNGTGWGNAAQSYILALDAAGIEVVPRHINIAGNDGEVPQRIEELEKRNAQGCDIVIQHILPHLMDYNGNFDKCIGLYFTETSHFKRSNWCQYLNLMDEVWVANEQQAQAAKDTGVLVPVSVLPIPCDVGKYAQRYKPYPIPELHKRFTFYTIGELTRRKNLVAMLKAFHLEFHPQEPVAIVIKARIPGESPMECNKHLHVIIEEVKRELKLYNINEYHQEILIMQSLTNEEVMRLHTTCDCFVCPSFGEAWSIPAFDAMAMGKTPICTDVGGMHDFLTTTVQEPVISRDFNGNPMPGCERYKTAGWLVPGYPTPAFGTSKQTLPYLFTGDEEWIDISISGLRKAMRQAYENKELKQEKEALGIDRAYDFSYEAVGERLRNALEDQKRLPHSSPAHDLSYLRK